MLDNHRRCFISAAAAAPLLLLFACSDGDGLTDLDPPEGPLIEFALFERVLTPSTAGPSVRVAWRFHNPLADTIFFANCNGGPQPGLDRLVDGIWVAASSNLTALCGAVSSPIAPGAIHADTTVRNLRLDGSVESYTGTYRLNWTNGNGVGPGAHLFRRVGLTEDGLGLQFTNPLPADFPIVSEPFELIDPRDRP